MKPTQARLKELFTLTDDGVFYRRINVKSALAGKRAGCYRKPDGYYLVRVDGRLYRGHQLIWLWHFNEWPASEIDHIDGNPSNNKICNLRVCNRSENCSNTKHRSNNTSGYKGVTWSKVANKWVACIFKNNKRIHLGCFVDPKDAFEAYKAAAEIKHKEFMSPTSFLHS